MVMQTTQELAQEMLRFAQGRIPEMELSFLKSAYDAGEYTESVFRGCMFFMNLRVEGAEDLLERGLDAGLRSKYFAEDFRELFSQKVA